MESDESKDHMVPITAKVPRELRDRIDATAADDEPRSAAIRRLVRTGLDAETGDRWRDRAGSAFGVLLVTGYPTAAAAGGAPYAALGWIALVTLAVLFEPWINAAIGKIPNPFRVFQS